MPEQLNVYTISFVLLNLSLFLILPRAWATFPLLMTTFLMTPFVAVEIGSVRFSILRIVLAAGFLRVILRSESISGGMNALDWLVISWSIWALVSSLFHENAGQTLVNRLGVIYDLAGAYFLIRCLIQENILPKLFSIIAILLAILAVAMIYEKLTLNNLFSIFGRIPPSSDFREGGLRAQGSFSHPILAGTVGAAHLPMMIYLWREYRGVCITGAASCAAIIAVSGSSGPVISALAGLFAIGMWNFRKHLRMVRWLAVLGYVGLEIIMEAPAYYLMARISPIGSSRGWHRARLIESAIEHLSEWWIVGTEYTRHWMPTGVYWSEDHTDITNYYIKMGVLGGLPLMLLFIVILAKSFQYVGQLLDTPDEHRTYIPSVMWIIGSSLFVHAVSCISVSYFDQSYLFLYLNIGVISSIWSLNRQATDDIHPELQPEPSR